jgi:hypothetical protein
MKIPQATTQRSGGNFFNAQTVRPVGDVTQHQTQYTQKALQGIQQAATTIQNDIDEAKAFESDNVAAEQFRKLSTTYEQSLGKNAVDAHSDYLEGIDKIATEINGSLDTDRQREMVGKVLNRRVQEARGRVDRHHNRQAKVFKLGEQDSRLSNFTNDAVLNIDTWDTPITHTKGDLPGVVPAYKSAVGGIATTVAQIVKEQGLSEAQGRDIYRQKMSNLHSLAIDAFMAKQGDGKVDSAQRYFDTYSAEMTPQVRERSKRMIDKASFRRDEINTYLAVKDQYPDPRAQAAFLKEQLDSGQMDSDMFDAVTNRAKREFAFEKQQKAVRSVSLVRTARSILDKNLGMAYSDLPENMQIDLEDQGHSRGVRSYADSGRYYTTEEGRKALFDRTPFRGLSAEELEAKYRTKMDDADLAKAEIARQEINGEKKSWSANSELKLLKQSATDLGLDDKGDEYLAFTDRLQAEIRSVQYGENKGAPVNRDQVEKIIEREKIDHVYKDRGFFMWDEKVPYISLSEDEQADAYVEVNGEEIRLGDIPTAEKQRLEAVMARNAPGSHITEAKVAELWYWEQQQAARN